MLSKLLHNVKVLWIIKKNTYIMGELKKEGTNTKVDLV